MSTENTTTVEQPAPAAVRSSDGLGRVLTCVYCGHEYPQDSPAWGNQVLTDHIKVCAQHPMRAVEARVKELEQALLDAQLGADGLLKTAHEREDALKAKVEAEFPTAEEYEGAAGDMREVIDNLALLLRRTSRRLDPRDRLRTECVDYLKKIGQAGQPLRPWCKTASKSPNLDTQPPAG